MQCACRSEEGVRASGIVLYRLLLATIQVLGTEPCLVFCKGSQLRTHLCSPSVFLDRVTQLGLELTMQRRVAWHSQSSCLSLVNAGITGILAALKDLAPRVTACSYL